MASFAFLPVELQYQCVQYFDIKTLKTFRLVSRTASEIATEHLFRTLVLQFTDESVGRFNCILANEPLKAKVKEIVIDGEEGTNEEFEWDDEGDNHIHKGTPWSNAIRKIAQFPNLHAAEFRFDEQCAVDDEYGYVKQDEEYRELYQELFFEALKDAHIDTLTLKNWQDETLGTTGTDETMRVVNSRLKRLALMIITENYSAAPENDIDMEALHQCFNSTLTNEWLSPLHSQLTHLTVYCDTYWGVYPFTDLRGLHFPHLVSLALGNWTIAHDWQIDWITSHGTLEELILDDVCIVHTMNMPVTMADANWPEQRPAEGWPDLSNIDVGYIIKEYGTRWSDIFPLFQARLQKLKHFGIGHGNWHDNMFAARYELPARIEESRYITYYHGIGPCQWTDEFCGDSDEMYLNEYGVKVRIAGLDSDQNVKDEEALDQFLRAIGVSTERIDRMKGITWDRQGKCWV